MSRCIFPIENGGVFSSQSLFVFRHSTLFSHHHGFKGKIYLLNGRKLIPNIWRYRHLFSTKKSMIVGRKTIHFNCLGVTKKVGRAETKRYQVEFWERRGKKHIDFFLQQRQVTTSLWSRWDCENSNLNRRSCFVDRWWIRYVFNLIFGIWSTSIFEIDDWGLRNHKVSSP